MTIVERNNKLKHYIACLKCEVSGKCCDDNCSTQYEAGNIGEIIENLEAISKALEQEPTTKNNLAVDCISREQALRELKESAEHHANDSREEVLLRRDRDIIRALPSVTPQEPKIGHWILADEQNKEDVENDNYRFICSECLYSDVHAKGIIVPYCWQCGTKMVETQESEDKK